MSGGELQVIDLGRRRYGEILELQRDLCRRRLAREIHSDILLLVEHDPVVTLGRGTRPSSLILPPGELEARGLEVFEVERGGDVTYHGPGQLVGYPILDLNGHRPDLHWYLREVEAALIESLSELDVRADRRAGLTGVWTRDRKIASIGIHVKQWVTFHGFALNVVNNLDNFELIIPCGIDNIEMTSVQRERGPLDIPDDLWWSTRSAVIAAFGRHFDRDPIETSLESAGIDPPPSLAPPRKQRTSQPRRVHQ
ncbi:MAG: lipoyl(octanoyl) transferase LipB [Gemmatimonadota bacterium]